jgi:outer membrane protein OmpA-like peptidoglycan-associated protein
VARPTISGTWSQPAAVSLSVSLAGTSYVLGTDEALTSAVPGTWSLAVPRPLKDGVYDVVVETTDASGNQAADKTKDELTVDAAGPAVPTVGLYAGESSPEKISGTWDSTAATSLTVAIPKAGIAAVLRRDPHLTSLTGVWTLALPRVLKSGSYDVVVESTDALGRVATDQTKFEILVKEAPPPPPPPPPYDCAGVLDKIGAVFPIRFDFDRTDLKSPYDLSVNHVAALLKDARCLETRAEVTGHADYLGPHLYNQALSERRAQVVIDLLSAAGVAPARLGVKGMSSSDPVDPAKGEAPRAKNRRVVIRIVQ